MGGWGAGGGGALLKYSGPRLSERGGESGVRGDRLLPLGSSAAVRYLLLAESPGAQGRRVRSAISPRRAFLRLPALARPRRERSPLSLALPVSLPYPLFLPADSLLSLALPVRPRPLSPLAVSPPRPTVRLSSSRISPSPLLFPHGPHLALSPLSLFMNFCPYLLLVSHK